MQLTMIWIQAFVMVTLKKKEEEEKKTDQHRLLYVFNPGIRCLNILFSC